MVVVDGVALCEGIDHCRRLAIHLYTAMYHTLPYLTLHETPFFIHFINLT